MPTSAETLKTDSFNGLPPAIAHLYQSIGRAGAWQESLARVTREHPWTGQFVSRLAGGNQSDSVTRDSGEPPIVMHLRNCARLHAAVHRAEGTESLLRGLLDHLPHACAVVGPAESVIALSSAARRILEGTDGLSLDSDGRLRASRPDVTAAIRSRIARTLADGSRQVLRVPRPSGRSPYVLMSVSLRSATTLDRFDQGGAAVFLADPCVAVWVDESLLQDQYGLTRAEALLARTLVEGRSLYEAADQLCVSVNTVRTHLSRIFSKTGTVRQGQLLTALLSGLASIGCE